MGGSGIQQNKMKIERTGRAVRLLSGSFFVRCCIKCKDRKPFQKGRTGHAFFTSFVQGEWIWPRLQKSMIF